VTRSGALFSAHSTFQRDFLYNAWLRYGTFFMAYIIAQPCIGTKDTACVVVCPVDCIHPTKDEPNFATEEMLYIDPDTCIDCNLCVDECPVTAIFAQADLPAEWASFIERNAAYYKKS
jgi:NAD-dependent dihydropyrimidine dehydrogenase PreA subunit